MSIISEKICSKNIKKLIYISYNSNKTNEITQ